MYKRHRPDPTLPALAVILVFTGIVVTFFAGTSLNIDSLLVPTLALIVCLLGIGLVGLLYFVCKQHQLVRALQLSDIDTMTGIAFERYVGDILKFQSYAIQYTPQSGDYGVDIVASKIGDRYAIQLKRYKGLVGREAISDAVAGMNYYKCNKSMVVTNNYFTPNAKILAASNSCVLIDRDTLTQWIVDFQKA